MNEWSGNCNGEWVRDVLPNNNRNPDVMRREVQQVTKMAGACHITRPHDSGNVQQSAAGAPHSSLRNGSTLANIPKLPGKEGPHCFTRMLAVK